MMCFCRQEDSIALVILSKSLLNLKVTRFPVCLSCQKFFRRKSARDLLPAKPVEISVEPWWVAQTGYITEDDIRVR